MADSAAASGWKWVFKPGMIVLGALFALGVLVLLQQYGVTTFTTGKLGAALVFGAILGVVLGSAGARRTRPAARAEASQ